MQAKGATDAFVVQSQGNVEERKNGVSPWSLSAAHYPLLPIVAFPPCRDGGDRAVYRLQRTQRKLSSGSANWELPTLLPLCFPGGYRIPAQTQGREREEFSWLEKGGRPNRAHEENPLFFNMAFFLRTLVAAGTGFLCFLLGRATGLQGNRVTYTERRLASDYDGPFSAKEKKRNRTGAAANHDRSDGRSRQRQ